MSWLEQYSNKLAHSIAFVDVQERDGKPVDKDHIIPVIWQKISSAHKGGNKVMFVGNGGSAAIASHAAIDYSRNGKRRSMAFNDGAALTCLGNDFGYGSVFEKQIEFQALKGDILVAISSSGNSENILRAVKKARKMGCYSVTFSGFEKSNALRELGDVNFYVSAAEYGFVELAHMSLIHAILDCGTGLDQ